MIKNHTHNNDSGSIHYIFKKILDLGFSRLFMIETIEQSRTI